MTGISNAKQSGREYARTTTITAHTTSDWYVEQALNLSDIPDGLYAITSNSTNMLQPANGCTGIFVVNGKSAPFISGGQYFATVTQIVKKTGSLTLPITVFVNAGGELTAGNAVHRIIKID